MTVDLPHAPQQIETVETWHVEVGDNQIEIAPGQEGQGGLPILGFETFVDADLPRCDAHEGPQ